MPSSNYKVIWSPEASIDLDEIIMTIAEEHSNNALSAFERIHKKAKSLSRFPSKGKIVPELKEFRILSYLQVAESPWRIIYRVSEKIVYVNAIIHCKRDIELFLLRRLTR